MSETFMGRPVLRNSPARFLRDLKRRVTGESAPSTTPGEPGVQYQPVQPSAPPMSETELMQQRQRSPIDRKRQLEEMLRGGR